MPPFILTVLTFIYPYVFYVARDHRDHVTLVTILPYDLPQLGHSDKL